VARRQIEVLQRGAVDWSMDSIACSGPTASTFCHRCGRRTACGAA